MRLIGAKTASNNWLAIGLHADRFDVAQVERRASGRPAVHLCESYSKAGGDVDALKALARAVRPQRFRCANLLQPSEYQIQLVEAPKVAPDELKSAVRWKLKDALDYPVDAATIDVADVPGEQGAGTRAHYVYAVSARNDRIGARMKLFRDAKFPLEAIDVPEMAQRNIAHLYERDGRGLAMLAFDASGGCLTFTAGGELYMTRHSDITAAELNSVDSEARTQAIERLVLELQRSFDHFDRQFSQVTVARVLLAPLAVDIGLERELSENLGLPVDTLDLTEVLDFPPASALRDPARQGHRLHIIGAALRD